MPERPSEDVVKAAEGALKGLKSQETQVFLLIGEKSIQLAPYVTNLLIDMFEQLSEGNPVSILPHNGEVTTGQAASILRRRDALARMTEIAEDLDLPD